MRRLVGGMIAALVLVALMVAPTLGHTATGTCDHITIGNVPKGVSATLTPGPITIAPPNKSTSINGTYVVPPATYQIVFSDGSIIHATVVPDCASPSPSSNDTPAPSASVLPSSADTPGPSTSPSPSSNGTPGASPSSSGGILGATATPRTTAPATDTLTDANSSGLGAGLPLLVFFLVGINIGLLLILRTPSRPFRRGRRG